ncbi:hypothetical protein DAPPUDRAFT_253253 [Daphnia pulex]|uniref:Uncharacterized protein n=1 Tax=Daphnia pulex TaxID=6669 RepID=E9H4E4_DAPPU|nr:hypothetical protein DAPPUDRAFT_253253 [Daphnia pulex]|eukprot:EFX73368.1 hypothetical protein DAPPUDRAFT_253253 [Daphnia pulex]
MQPSSSNETEEVISEDACSDNEQSTDTEEQPSSALYLNEACHEDTPLTFKRLLQHFAVYTKQKKSSIIS